MVIWFRLTMRPRISAGLTSAIYIGARAEATPMPTPPTKRAILNRVKSLNSPVPMADTVNSTADSISSGLRPYLSAAPPATIAPTRQPTRAVVMATPCIRGESADAEIQFIERLCTANHHPVVAEEQTAHGRHGTDEIEKALVRLGLFYEWLSYLRAAITLF